MSLQKTGFTLWFTGLSGARKTALSREVAEILRKRGHRVEVLEGHEVGQSDGLAFSKEYPDKKHRTHRISPNLPSRNGAVACTADTSRNRSVREDGPRKPQDVEAYVTCSLQAVIQRDAKGVRFTQMVLNEGLRRGQPAELLDARLRRVRNYKKRSSKHERGKHRHSRGRQRSGRTADPLKLGFTIQAVRQDPGASMS